MQNVEQLAREERNAYFRAWRAKNKDKVKAINNRYWEKKAQAKLNEKAEDSENDR